MSQTEDIHAVRMKRDGKKDKGDQRGRTKGLTQERKQPEQKQPSILKCEYCGKTHRRIKEECPAWGFTIWTAVHVVTSYGQFRLWKTRVCHYMEHSMII